MKITVLYDFFFEKPTDEHLARVQDAAPDNEITLIHSKNVKVEDLVDSEIVFGRIPPPLLKDLPNLKWLHLGSAGANGMTDISLYANKSVLLTNSSGTYGITIAEHVVGMMVFLNREFGYYYKKQMEKQWSNEYLGIRDIHGSTVLILGLGDIGTEVCKRLSAFGCRFIGFRRNASIPHDLISDVRPMSRLRESLPEADYVVICTPGTKETENLFGREEFELMKEQAMIINIGRGMSIDSDALAEALNDGKIFAAGLDVTSPEPLPEDHPLWSARNVFITPHVSGDSESVAELRVSIFIDLLKRYLAGGEMYNIVDFDAGY